MVLSPLFCSAYVRCFPIPLQVCWGFAATLAFCSEQAGRSPAYSLFRAALVTFFTLNLLFLSRLSVGFLGQSGVSLAPLAAADPVRATQTGQADGPPAAPPSVASNGKLPNLCFSKKT